MSRPAGAAMAVSVVICAYTERRWEDLLAAVDSARRQDHPPLEIVVVIDHNATLLARARVALGDVVVIANDEQQGLSGGRNTAIRRASGEIVAFLDDDAVAEPDWLSQLTANFVSPDVLVVGGTARPAWETGRPGWFPEEFDWVVGCTHRGTPTQRADVRNVIGCNMAFRRHALEVTDGFHAGLGRVGTVPLGCEETELCIRLRRDEPTARVVFEPAALVRHHVTPERSTLRYFVARCRAEGMSKSVVASLVGAEIGMASERVYATRVLPRAVGTGLADIFRGRPAGVLRSGAVMLGLASFALGYAQAELARRRGRVVLSHSLRVAAHRSVVPRGET